MCDMCDMCDMCEMSEKDYNELIQLANEPLEGNTISLDEFKKIVEKWLMK